MGCFAIIVIGPRLLIYEYLNRKLQLRDEGSHWMKIFQFESQLLLTSLKIIIYA